MGAEKWSWIASEICCPHFSVSRFSSIIRLRGVFDDKAGFQFADLLGQAGGFDAVEDFFEVFVGVGSFVDRVLAGVVEDVVGFEVGVDLTVECVESEIGRLRESWQSEVRSQTW